MDEGASALRKGDPKQAEVDFSQELAVNPKSADAHLGLGLAQLRQGRMQDAEASLGLASELNPSLLSAHLFRGIALSQMNSLDAALAQIKQEIILQPKSSEALTWLGIVELQATQPQSASEAFDHAAALSPGDQNLLYFQVRSHTLAAQQAFRALFKIDPDSAFVHRAQAEIYAESEQPDKAIQEYQAALKRTPANAELYEALANEEQKISQVAEAAAAYQEELKLAPNSAIALYNLGKMQVERGDPQRGVDLLQRALAANAVPAPTAFYLGFGLAKLGRNEEAATWLERALANSPSDFIRQSDYYELVRVYQKLNRGADSQRALEELKRLKGQAPAKAENP
jgi:superkiller protein 3